MKSLIFKLHLLMVTVFAFEWDICLGEGDALLGTMPGTIGPRQMRPALGGHDLEGGAGRWRNILLP